MLSNVDSACIVAGCGRGRGRGTFFRDAFVPSSITAEGLHPMQCGIWISEEGVVPLQKVGNEEWHVSEINPTRTASWGRIWRHQ